jgi:hypothetical protein
MIAWLARALAQELVALKVDVILARSSTFVEAAIATAICSKRTRLSNSKSRSRPQRRREIARGWWSVPHRPGVTTLSAAHAAQLDALIAANWQ